MRGRTGLFLALLAIAVVEPGAATAQFSPRGVFGAVTYPFREMFGRFGHHRRRHSRESRSAHSRDARPPQSAAASQKDQARGQDEQSRFGVAGPIVWPRAYEQVLGYTFWPGDYADRVRARGFDVIADTIAQPQDNREPTRVATTGTVVPGGQAGSLRERPCDDAANAPLTWPVTRIQQTTKMTDVQQDALDKLRAALAQAISAIKAGCRDTAALPPRERLHVLVQQLWAVRDAGIFVRAPLKTFYDSLTDAQKAAFTIPPQSDSPRNAKIARAAMMKQQQACASHSLENSERMISQIERKIRPTKEQRTGFEALRKTSSDMAKLLAASCAQPIPADPLARLDDADNQLTSMNYAAAAIQIALNGFYIQLNGEQKAKFNALSR